jgi:hypothetical protein
MPVAYNPIVRTFCKLRAALLSNREIARIEIRPGTALETLMPMGARRLTWRRLQQHGLRMPVLELSERDRRRNCFHVLRGLVSSACYLQTWYALLLIFPLAAAVHWASRRRAVHFPLGLKTVGELVIYTTCFAEHKGSGYRWTKNEITMKVRMVVAESAGLPLEDVQPETRLMEL